MSKPAPRPGAGKGVPSTVARPGNNLRGRGGPPPARDAASGYSSGAQPASGVKKVQSKASAIDESENHLQMGLKIVNGSQELPILDNKVTIGRRKECDIWLDGQAGIHDHCEITNGFALDSGSTNGTTLNGVVLKHGVKKMLKAGDKLQIGDRTLRIESGPPRKDEDDQDLSRSKKFIGGVGGKGGKGGAGGKPAGKDGAAGEDAEKDDASSSSAEAKEIDEDAKLTVEELMDKEFSKIIGHDSLKKQLRQFYKKVQLDQIRQNAGKEKDKKRLYHMIFSGPPGTGKTTMANLVSKIMLKMKLVTSDKVVFVGNALELLGSYVGQTPAKVDAKVAEAKGGICFIDEAYSIVKGGGDRDSNGGQFGREAIDTIMKHMDPPTVVFIFAGYEKPMEDFLRVNEGLARRIPYRYQFEAYNIDQLCQIFRVMYESKGEILEPGVEEEVPKMLKSIDEYMLSTQNAGLIQNWLSFAQGERDDRVDIDEALANPDLASTLAASDLIQALVRVKEMKGAEKKPPGGGGGGSSSSDKEPELQYAEQ